MNKFNQVAAAGYLAILSALLAGVGIGATAMVVGTAQKGPQQPPFTAHVDDDTSCEYLITREGHITPRLHADGTQVCMGEDQLMARLPDYHGDHSPDYYDSANEVYVSPMPLLPPHEQTEWERQP